MASRKLDDLLNQHLQAVAFVTFADGTIITTKTKSFSKYKSLYIHSLHTDSNSHTYTHAYNHYLLFNASECWQHNTQM